MGLWCSAWRKGSMFKTEMQPSARVPHTHVMLRVATSAAFSGIPFGVAICCNCMRLLWKKMAWRVDGVQSTLLNWKRLRSNASSVPEIVFQDSVPVLNLESETQSRNMIWGGTSWLALTFRKRNHLNFKACVPRRYMCKSIPLAESTPLLQCAHNFRGVTILYFVRSPSAGAKKWFLESSSQIQNLSLLARLEVA